MGLTIPEFQLPNLLVTNKTFSQKDLLGRVTLLNVWATWCYACGVELPMLMKIKNEYGVPIYSIDYKDNPQDAKKWLQQNGNPYLITGSDVKGDVVIDLGVYGTPETFVISPEGKIIYRHIGVLDQRSWDTILHPLVKQYGG